MLQILQGSLFCQNLDISWAFSKALGANFRVSNAIAFAEHGGSPKELQFVEWRKEQSVFMAFFSSLIYFWTSPLVRTGPTWSILSKRSKSKLGYKN